MYVVGLDVDSRAYFTSATCAISFLCLMNTWVFLQIFSNKLLLNKLDRKFKRNFMNSVPLFKEKRSEGGELVLYNWLEKRNNKLVKGILKKRERDMINLTKYQKGIIIGMLLSDGWMRNKEGWNSSIGLKQSIKNFDYLWDVFHSLANICSSYPYLCSNMLRGKKFYGLQFESRKLVCLKEIKQLFYIEGDNKKRVLPELINYFDYVVLAHWIMGDGARRNNGIILCTDSYSIEEVVLLMNILYIKFNIRSTIHYDNGRNRIHINKKNLLKIRSKLLPHFNKHFLYKIT
mgnify:CR=1 FL=1